MDSVLSALLASENPATFLNDLWPDVAHFVHAPIERLDLLAAARTLEELLRLEHLDVHAHLRTPAGDARTIETRAKDAACLLEVGATVYVRWLRSAKLDAWASAFETALALVPGTVKINAFASRRGPGVPTHFDAQDIFVVQLHGEKRWRIAPNIDVKYPIEGATLGARSAAGHQVMPEGHRTIDLAPGSVLFLPRGTWHDTQTTGGEESVHLVVQCKLPTWSDVLRSMLDNPAMQTLQWREPVLRLWADGRLRSDVVDQVRRRLDATLGPLDAARLEESYLRAKLNGPKSY